VGLIPKKFKNPNQGQMIERTDEQRNAVPNHPKVEAGKAMAQRGNAKNDKRRSELEAKAGKGNLTRKERQELERLMGLG
jgi:hypothetical protein